MLHRGRPRLLRLCIGLLRSNRQYVLNDDSVNNHIHQKKHYFSRYCKTGHEQRLFPVDYLSA